MKRTSLLGFRNRRNLDPISVADALELRRILAGQHVRSSPYDSTRLLGHVNRAADLLERKKTERAFVSLHEAFNVLDRAPNLQQSPLYIDALLLASEGYLRYKDHGNARDYAGAALNEAPNDLRAILVYGERCRDRNPLSRRGRGIWNRNLRITGLEGVEDIQPDYMEAQRVLEHAERVLDLRNNAFGITTEYREKVAREVYLRLGVAYRMMHEEGVSGMPGAPVDETDVARAFHKAFHATPDRQAADASALETHYALNVAYDTWVHRLESGLNIANAHVAVNPANQTLVNEGNAARKIRTWQSKKDAACKYIQAYQAQNPAGVAVPWLTPLRELASLHGHIRDTIASGGRI